MTGFSPTPLGRLSSHQGQRLSSGTNQHPTAKTHGSFEDQWNAFRFLLHQGRSYGRVGTIGQTVNQCYKQLLEKLRGPVGKHFSRAMRLPTMGYALLLVPERLCRFRALLNGVIHWRWLSGDSHRVSGVSFFWLPSRYFLPVSGAFSKNGSHLKIIY